MSGRFSRNLLIPGYDLMIKTWQDEPDGQVTIEEVRLYIYRAPYQIRRNSPAKVIQEAERILQQCYLHPPSMQVSDLGTALRRFVGGSSQNLPKDLQGRHLPVPEKRAEQKLRREIQAKLAELAA